jgi:hypothetical protein
VDPEAEYAEYDVAEDGAGSFLVYRRGAWHPSNERGELLQSIPADDWEPGAVELPNGAIMGPRGSRGGKREKIGENERPDAYSALGEAPSVTAETRGRLAFGLPGAIAARRRMAEMESGGVNPLNRDWGASLIQMVPDFGAMDTAARIAGGQDFQNYDQAAASIEAAVLPIFSGLAVTESEARRFVRANVPRLGDTPETLVEKGRNIERVMNTGSWMMGQPIPFPEVPLFVPADEGFGGADAAAIGAGAAAGGGAGRPGAGGNAANPLLGPTDPATGLPTYPTIQGGREIATPPTGPGASAEEPIDLTTASRDEVIAAIQRGGWFRQGPDGEPYELPASTPEFGAQPGDEMVAPGVGVRPRSSAVGAEQVLGGQAAFARSALEQVPFGDELMAGFAGVMSGQGYDRMREAQGALADYDRQNNRFERNMGGVAGATAQIPVGMGVAGMAPRALQMAPRVAGATRLANTGRLAANAGRAGAAGGATGAFYGAGAGEGGLAERADDAVQGGVLGAVATPIVGAAARPVINNVLAPAGRVIARPIAALGERFGVPGAAEASRRLAPNVLEGAVDRYGARFNPDAGVLARQADERAAQGLETTVVDLMDESQRGLGRALATRQTPARQAVREFAEGRAENLPDRMAMQARRTMSPDPRSPAEIRDQLAETGRREAAPLYEAAYAEPFTPTPVIEDILSRPAGRAALERAARIAANEGRDPNSIGLIVSEAGPVAVRAPTMQTMDYVKRGLDDVLEGYRDSTTGRMNLDTEGRAIDGLRRQFRNELDQINPAYGAARAAYADTAQLQRATELGENFLSMEADEFSRQASRLNPAEREVAVAAARRAVERGAGTQGAAPGVAQRLASGREQNMRNAALLENPIPMQDAMRAEREGVMAARAVYPGSGSITSQAVSDQAQAGMNVLSAGANAVTGNVRGTVGALGRLVRLGYSDQEANALMTAAIDPNRTREVIDMLATRMNRQDARSMLRAIRFSAARGAGEYAGDEE